MGAELAALQKETVDIWADVAQDAELLQDSWDIGEVRRWLMTMAEDIEADAEWDPQDGTQEWAKRFLSVQPVDRERMVWDLTRRIRAMQIAKSQLTVLAARCVHAFWESLPANIPLTDRPSVSMDYGRCYLCRCRFRQGEDYRVLSYVAAHVKEHFRKRQGATVSGDLLLVNLCYRCLHTTPRGHRPE